MLPLGVVFGVLVAGVVTFFVPEVHQSEALIEIPVRNGAVRVQSSVLERIKSRASLEKVVDQLGLADKWDLDSKDAVGALREMVSYQEVHGTDLVSVKVRHSDPKETVRIADAVVRNFKDGLAKMEQARIGKAIEDLDVAIMESRLDLERDREIFVKEVWKWRAGHENRDACVLAKNAWHDTLERLSQMHFELVEMEAYQSVPGAAVLIHQEPEAALSIVSPNIPTNLTWGALGGFLLAGCLALILRPHQ